MGDSILLVDDEPRILSAFRRQLQALSSYEIESASSGSAALELMISHPPFSVIVSDMRMPNMDGIALLRETERKHPNTVRIMLTGVTDQETSVEAINEGHIFRFLSKPCSIEKLLKAIDDGVRQYHLITAEKDLLQHTLGGLIKMLTEILSMIDPTGFGQGLSLREPIRELSQEIDLPSTWDIELAAMLSHIGRVILPTEVASKLQREWTLTPEEQAVLLRVPETGFSLLSNIPRLENVAEIVRYQDRYYDGSGHPSGGPSGENIPLGARILTLLRDFEELRRKSDSNYALREISRMSKRYDPKLVQSLTTLVNGKDVESQAKRQIDVFEVCARELVPGQIVLEPVETREGVLLVAAGVRLTETSIERLRNYARLVGIREPLRVNCRIPAPD